MAELMVFIPAWNEELNLPDVLTELSLELPDADIVVIDDGSTDGTARVAAGHGAHVVSFGENRGLKAAIAEGYMHAEREGYWYCGRVDGDGQHPAAELARILVDVRADRCDVAVGSRFMPDGELESDRYQLRGARRLGTAFMQHAMGAFLGQPFHDPMSGLWAVNRTAIPVLAEPYTSEAPEVEALLRVRRAGLRLEEVPVHMRPRATGESKLQGKKAVGVVVTVAATLWLGRRLLRRRT